MLYKIGCFLCRMIILLFGGMTVVGQENIPEEGGVIIAPNHLSFIDPPATGVSVKRPVWFMAKSELFKVPVFGSIIRKTHAFPVRRGTADRAAFKQAISLLHEGKMVLIFPEGKRGEPGHLGKPERGIGLIAIHAKVPVVPIALIGTEKMLPKHFFLMKRHHIKIRIGEPVSLEDLYSQPETRETLSEVGQRVMASIEKMLEEENAADTACKSNQ